jgi:hypothetical protein
MDDRALRAAILSQDITPKLLDKYDECSDNIKFASMGKQIGQHDQNAENYIYARCSWTKANTPFIESLRQASLKRKEEREAEEQRSALEYRGINAANAVRQWKGGRTRRRIKQRRATRRAKKRTRRSKS